jgi:hypothetical protein
MNDSSPSDISSTAGEEHPVASATLEHFTVNDMAKKNLGYVNRYRLANVLFSEGLRELILTRGLSCSRVELDLGFKSDQKMGQRTSVEYNKRDVDEYDRVQCQVDLAPKNFTEISWRSVTKIWKECVYKVEQAVAWKNRSGNNDSDGEEED